jgi:hypothetical protein
MDANATLISTTTAAAEQTTLNLESAVLNIERIIDYGWGISGSGRFGRLFSSCSFTIFA